MGIVFTEMSSCRILTWLFGMKTAFQTKYMKSEYFRIFIIKILTLRVIEEMHIKRNAALNNKELMKLGFSATVVLWYAFSNYVKKN